MNLQSIESDLHPSLSVDMSTGVKIIISDYRECTSIDDQKEVILAARNFILSQPDHSVREIVMFEGQKVSTELTKHAKAVTAEIDPKMIGLAFVGITGLQKIIMNSLARISKKAMKAFDTEHEAKNFLINIE